ncbi:hypothetical protein [Nitrospirillum viridazoti]|uniref:DUF1579 domain-containing protein n=1 Tax=Nitrospirillum viridazoti CBAmc TaxID=1441467 RepID=A0A248JX10_9PROT|nr:hypothetical protein [Nitrospirillum amazonense]ASG23262.1 hypothetical protein Y958_20760 [Nitrospirillum amazonense CBAmc]TWB40079.1 hypothetical protein FBZ91_105315 [Nitrospirillum amazonense]
MHDTSTLTPTRRAALLGAGLMAFAAPARAEHLPTVDRRPTDPDQPDLLTGGPGAGDFDFLAGRWSVLSRRRLNRWVGDDRWDEARASAHGQVMLGGLACLDELELPAPADRPGAAVTFRLYDPAARHWAFHRVDGRTGTLQAPLIGRFTGGLFAGRRGDFRGQDFDPLLGRPVQARVIWSRITTSSALWEQAWSADEGRSWETNWTLAFTRA